ncbi:WD repeat-containing protein wrap73 [Dissophora ornata]|nr:WD repeat-containing protein wrap73 [Dissophora ornata]
MDFTEPYKHSQFLTLYSPNGKYLASYHLAQEGFVRLHPSAPVQANEDGGRGVIIFRFAATMQIMRAIEIRLFRDSLPTISEIGWSPDSTMLLAACPVTGTILVFSVEEEEFRATITVPGIIGSNSGGPGSYGSGTAGGGKGQNGQLKNSETKQMRELRALGYTPPGGEVLRGVRFSADSRHILIWEDHLLRLSIWSLESSSEVSTHSLTPHQEQRQQHTRVHAIDHPKATSRSSVSSSSIPPYSTLGTTSTSATGVASQYACGLRGDLQYFAIVERNGRECRDYISVYATEDFWTRPPVHTFGVATESGGGIKDVEGIAWSPDGRYLAVWENPLLDFRIAVYSLDGRRVGFYEVTPENESSSNAAPREFSSGGGGMGVKSVCWHPGSKLLALGGYDQKIRLLNHLTWKPIVEFCHTAQIKYGSGTVLWRESDSTVAVAGSVRVQGGIEYTVADQPAWIPTVRVDTQKPNAKIGVGWCDFNCEGTLLASRNDNMPNALWIWSMLELKPVVIIQQQSPIKICRWDPGSPSRIVWCCGSGYIYSWQASLEVYGGVIEAVEVPGEGFEVSSLKWCPDGKGLLLMDKEMFCVAFPIEEDEQHTIHEDTASIFAQRR